MLPKLMKMVERGDGEDEKVIGPTENRREGYSIVLVGAVKMCK